MVAPVGPGCSGGTGLNLTFGPAILGQTAILTVSQAPIVRPGWIGMSAPGSPGFLVSAGCTVWLDPATLFLALTFTTNFSGQWTAPILVPPWAFFAGAIFRTQAVVLPTAGPLLLSNALDLTLGY
jgi:hypothetical protein